MTNLEQYLNAATRGLWGKHKLEVREELEAHVLEQTRKHELLGATRENAIAKVLADIGPANIVSRGMIGVHTMPNVFCTAIAAAFLTGLGVTSINSGTAQVATTTKGPTKFCAVCAKYESKYGTNWISLDSLETTLKQQKVATTRTRNGLQIHFEKKSVLFKPSYTTTGNSYIAWNKFWWQLMSDLEVTKTQISFTGWSTPRISIGKTVLRLGTPEAPFNSADVYQDLLHAILVQSFHFWGGSSYGFANKSVSPHHFIRTDQPNETAFALITRDQQGRINFDIAPARDGAIDLYVPQKSIRFVNDFRKLSPYKSAGRTNAMLIQFTAGYSSKNGPGHEIIVPEKQESDAVK